MAEIIKKGYKVNGKLGRKVAQWIKNWKLKLWHGGKIEKLNLYKEGHKEKM